MRKNKTEREIKKIEENWRKEFEKDFSLYFVLRNKLLKVKYQKVFQKFYFNYTKSELAFLLTLLYLRENKKQEYEELKNQFLEWWGGKE